MCVGASAAKRPTSSGPKGPHTATMSATFLQDRALDKQIEQTERELAELVEQELKYTEQNKILYWYPNSLKQLAFFENANRKRRSIFAGNRFGKSTAGVVEDICWLLGYRPFFSEDNPLRYAGIPEDGVKGLVIAADWDKVKELFTATGEKGGTKGLFYEMLPTWSISGHHTRQDGTIDIIYITSEVRGRKRQSSIYFDTVKSFKNDGQAHESSHWDFIHVDEPIPQDMWIACSRGMMDKGGSSWWLMTPLKETWMYYYVMENVTDKEFWYVIADADDNPSLNQEERARFYRSLSEEELDCRKRGLPLAFGSLIYANYDDNYHLLDSDCPQGWKSQTQPPSDWNTAVALDIHGEKPQAALFVAWSKMSVIFYAEIFKKCLLEDFAKSILAIRGKRIFNLEICDPFAWNPNPINGVPWAQIFYDLGLRVKKASKQRELGEIQTRSMWSERGRQIRVVPSLHFFRKEIRQYAYGSNGKPEDKDDHMMENLYRLHIATKGFKYIEPRVEPPEPEFPNSEQKKKKEFSYLDSNPDFSLPQSSTAGVI